MQRLYRKLQLLTKKLQAMDKSSIYAFMVLGFFTIVAIIVV